MNGFFLVNKGYGDSSNFVVHEIKKTFSFEKVGHLGTLDPAAEGLLIVAINRATKFSNYFLNADKSYDVSVELGVSTNTDDATGEIIYESQNIPKKQKIVEEIHKFKGISMQKPPFFSALRLRGSSSLMGLGYYFGVRYFLSWWTHHQNTDASTFSSSSATFRSGSSVEATPAAAPTARPPGGGGTMGAAVT